MGAIGRTNTGGAGLNLTILASVTQPSNPVDNMIWFNTDIAIPHWYFQNTEPSDPELGDAYITITTTATNVLQILRNNGMELYFGTPRQWDGENWNIIGGKIYYSGTWHNLQTFVYDGTIGNAENNFNHNVGGYPWWKSGSNATELVESNDSFTCKFSGGTGGAGLWYTSKKIDFSSIKSVKIVYTCSSTGSGANARTSVFTSASGGNESGLVASASISNNNAKTTVTIDTENVTGEYYLGFAATNGTTYNWVKTINVFSIELIG